MKNVSLLSLFFLVILISSCSDNETGSGFQKDQLGMIVPGKNEGTTNSSKTILFKNGMIAKVVSGDNILGRAKTGETFLLAFKELGTTDGVTEIELLNAAKTNDAAFSLTVAADSIEGYYEGDFWETHMDSTGIGYSRYGITYLLLDSFSQGNTYEYISRYWGEPKINGRGDYDVNGNDFVFHQTIPNPPVSNITLNGDYTGGIYGDETYGHYLYLHRDFGNGVDISYYLQRVSQ